MKRLHRMILRMLPGPFLGWLGTLMFLLLMQFLIRYLPEIAGRGLPLGVILELIAYNLAYMVVLAVPMSALLASLMAFGRLAESNAYAVIKNAGISLLQLIWPSLVVGLVLAAGMMYFNNIILPEANFRAKNLFHDIRSKKPGFELRPGIFYEGIDDYSILIQDLSPEGDVLHDVLIYDHSEGAMRKAVIKARRGHLEAYADFVDLRLVDGEIHRRISAPAPGIEERYEVLRFDRYRMRLDLSDFAFRRSDPEEGYRSDRTTPTADMIRFVDSLETGIAEQRASLLEQFVRLGTDSGRNHVRDLPIPLATPAAVDSQALPVHRASLAGLSFSEAMATYERALQQARLMRVQIDDAHRLIQWESQRADRYRVEIHKKFSIAVACLIFMLIGAPLGLSIRRGGLGTVGALALGIFLFYWITLVQGEKLADRDLLAPWIGMWIANLIMTLVGLWLVVYVTLDLRATPPLRRRVRRWLERRQAI